MSDPLGDNHINYVRGIRLSLDCTHWIVVEICDTSSPTDYDPEVGLFQCPRVILIHKWGKRRKLHDSTLVGEHRQTAWVNQFSNAILSDVLSRIS